MHYDELENRILREALYFTYNKSTVRATAKAFRLSKSTVYKDLAERLPLINPSLSAEVSKILMINKVERAIRGGEATRKKYLNLKEK